MKDRVDDAVILAVQHHQAGRVAGGGRLLRNQFFR